MVPHESALNRYMLGARIPISPEAESKLVRYRDIARRVGSKLPGSTNDSVQTALDGILESVQKAKSRPAFNRQDPQATRTFLGTFTSF